MQKSIMIIAAIAIATPATAQGIWDTIPVPVVKPHTAPPELSAPDLGRLHMAPLPPPIVRNGSIWPQPHMADYLLAGQYCDGQGRCFIVAPMGR